jgi:hypothetical protein
MAKSTSETISREETGRKDETTFKKSEQDAYLDFENPQGDESNSSNFNREMRQQDDDLNSKNYRQEPYQETEKKGKNDNSNNQEPKSEL